ncbi:MAG: response regulator [Candidatus Riflebacteria bacterium]|nr:response regulator [Candidatus Riflebacteria bacterium]
MTTTIPTPLPESSLPKIPPPLILIIEDDPDTLSLLDQTLTEEGYRVEQAMDGQTGLEAIQTLHPELILCDIMMPHIDGFELCKRVRADEKNHTLPILLLTAKDEFGDKMRGFRAGADDYITKPFVIGELMARIGAHMRIRKLQRRLAYSEDRYRELIEHSPDGILLISPDMELLFHNTRFTEIMKGKVNKTLTGCTLQSLFPFSDLFREISKLIGQIKSSGRSEINETRVNASNQQTVYFEIIGMPIKNYNGDVEMYQAIVRDVTQRRNIEEALLQAEKMNSLGILTAGIAHEVNNPLTGISNAVQIIKKGGVASERSGELCDLILTNINRITKIIKELQIFSRPQGRAPEIFSIGEAVDGSISLARYQTRGDRIEFVWNQSPENLYLFGDRNQFQQVMISLFVNSMQAIEKDGTITVSLERQGNNASLVVADTGCGIAPEQLGQIFDPFFTTKRDWKGVGLGLAVSFRIIQLFKGQLNVSSTLGKGTRFTIQVPLFQHKPKSMGSDPALSVTENRKASDSKK